MEAQVSESQAAVNLSSSRGQSPVSLAQRSAMLFFLLAGVAITVFGLISFDWKGRPPFQRPEAIAIAITMALPAAALFGGVSWSRWSSLGAVVCVGALFVTYGPSVVGVMVFCGLGFIAAGMLVFRIRLDSIESGLLALVLGYGLAGVFIGYTAQLRIHYDFTYGAALLGCIVLGRRQLAAWLTQLWARLNKPAEGPVVERIFGNAGTAAAVIVLIALMLYATARESGYDGMVTHLYLIESLRQSGKFDFDPTLSPFVFSPKTAIWGLGVFDVVGGEFAMRAAHASLLAVTAGLVGMRAAETMGRAGAGIIVATFVSAPVAFWVSSHLFEETGTLVFVTASVVFFLRGLNGRDALLQDVAGLACLGMAVSSKPQALFLGFLGVAYVVRRIVLTPSLKGFLTVAGSSAIFLAMAVGPYARAYLATQNPFFPFKVGETVDARWEHPFTVTTPYDMVFFTARHMETYSGGFAFQFLILLACAVASITLFRLKSVSTLAIVALVFASALATQTLYARYQIYAFPIYMLTCAAIYPMIPRLAQWGLCVALAVLVPLNVRFWSAVHVHDFSVPQLISPELNSSVPPERKAFAAINDLFGANARVYVAGPRFSAGLAGTPHAVSEAASRIDAAVTVQDVAREIREARITHIVASYPVRNRVVLEACEIICREYPIGAADYKIFAVDLSRASLVADRVDAAQLLGVYGEDSQGPEQLATIEPGEGWGLRESWGWWSIGSEAEVKLGPGFAGASALKVRLQAFTPPGTSGLDVIILLDGVQVGSWRFEPGPIGDVVEREVNLGAPIEAAAGKVLRFRFSRTFVPKDTVGGTDERQLALGLIDITR